MEGTDLARRSPWFSDLPCSHLERCWKTLMTASFSRSWAWRARILNTEHTHDEFEKRSGCKIKLLRSGAVEKGTCSSSPGVCDWAGCHWNCCSVNDGVSVWWWLYLCDKYVARLKSAAGLAGYLLFIINIIFDLTFLYLCAAAVAAASMANCLIVLSSRYFCSHLVISASRARMHSSFSLSCCCRAKELDAVAVGSAPCFWGRDKKKKTVRNFKWQTLSTRDVWYELFF